MKTARIGWTLLWVFGVPMPLLVLLMVLREVTLGRSAPERKPTALN